MKRRILSIVTALALCLSLCPTWALAAEADPSLCKHHPEHTEDCGYTAPTEGHDCGHRHTAECYTKGVLPDADGGDYYEIGADTENLLDCQHSHDSECGYVQADPGASCGYVCHICPIEDLIAALPEQVTEDNADDVRAQLDHILDLYRELTEDEQGQLDLSRVTALQEALDAANDPDPIAESVNYQEASWNGGVTYTTKTADSCTPVADSTTAVTWNAGWYVANSTVTIFEPITVTGAVNLILGDGCTLNAEKGIVVTTGNSLTIYAQSGGTGTLNATGTTDSNNNASAGIGGSTSSLDSSTITIHGGVINATGGVVNDNFGDPNYGAAGIGGGTSRSGNGGSSGAVIIYGGTVTANSGAGSVTGAGIGGGGSGQQNGGAGNDITIYGGSVTAASTGANSGGAGIGGGGGLTGGGAGNNIQIYGGTINATGSEGGAGIGGGGAGAGGTSGAGTNITISGGIVIAVGGTNAAGIGGGGGYSTQYISCTGGAGSVTITGGIVDAKGGAGNSSGDYAGAPIGNGGNTTAAATVNKTIGIVFENGAGTVCGDVTLDGSYNVPAGYTLNIPAGASLSGSGTFSGGSAFTTENLTEDMISVPTGLYYTGKDRTEDITTELSSELTKGVTICGQTFTVSGWTLAVEKAADSDLTYTATYTNNNDGTKTFTKTITLLKSGTEFEDGIKTYNGETQTDTFTAGDTITVKAAPTPTGDAPQKAAARLRADPTEGQMVVYVGTTQVSVPADKGEDGTYTMEVSAADVLLAAGSPGTEIPLTARFTANDNMADGTGTVTVNITAAAKAERDGKVIGYYDESNLDKAFANDGATVTLLDNITTSMHVGVDTGNLTLDLNGKTITKPASYGLYVSGSGHLTIRGNGKVICTGTSGHYPEAITSLGGTLTLESGTFIGIMYGVHVRGETSVLSVTGESVSIQCEGRGLYISQAQSVELSAGTYSSISVYTFNTLASLLAENCAYYKGSTPVLLSELEGKTELTGPVTVQACQHTAAEYTPNENDASTHTKTCLACGYTETGDCGFEKTADPTADSHTGQCPNCKRDRSGAHSFSEWSGNPVARACTVCGYEQTAVAKVEKSNSGGTEYMTVKGLNTVFASNSDYEGATVTLLDDVTITEAADRPRINIRCTLNLNGHTIRSDTVGAPPLEVSGYGNVTITGNGKVVSNSNIALLVLGTVVLKGGTFSSGVAYSGAVEVMSGNLSVTGENVVMENTGSGGYGLAVNNAQSVQLSTGKYSGVAGAISVSADGFTLGDLLNQEGASRVAYYKDNATLVTEGLDGQTLPSGSYTVRACTHAYQYTHTTGATTHSQTCPACGDAKAAETCSYDAATGRCACGSTLAVTLPADLALTYDGTAKTPAVTVTVDGTELAAAKYQINYDNNINAGNTAKVTVTAANGSFSGSVSMTFSIGKATLYVAPNSQTIHYGEPIREGAGAILTNGLATGDHVVGVTLTPDTKDVPGGRIIASEVQIQNESGADVTGNYEITYVPGNLTINPVDVKLTFNDQTITYGDTPTLATADPASAKIEYSYTTGEGGEPISSWPTNAGTYTVTAKVEATGNYGEASETATLTINPKAVSNPTIELSPNTFVYDGTGKEPAVTVKDGEKVIPADEYTVGYSNNINAGTATVTITNVAGNYTVSGTTTFAITAKPLAGAKVEVTGTFTYTGSAQEPAPTVTLDGKTLTANADYTVAYDKNTDAGTATITVTGKGNYSGTAQGTFTIGRADLTVDGIGTASGTYGDKLSELTVGGLTAKLGEATVTGTWKLAGGTVPNVGDSGEYTATFTPDSGADNYNPLTAQVKLNIAKANYTGTKTASTSAKFGTTGIYDLSALLPDGATAGTAATTSGIFEGAPAVSGKTLTYQLKAGAAVGSTGPITVPVISANYEDFNLTITVTVTDKEVPTLTVSPITITYSGEAVPDTAIKGTAKVGDTSVPGTWSFTEGQALTNVADSGTKTVKFVPTDGTNYAEATGTVVVTINKATPTGAPKYTAISTSGKTLADAGLTTEGGTLKPAGTVAWVLTDTTEVTANTQYEWTFTPTDTANYNTLTGKITLWPYTAPVNPGGGYVPSNPGGTSLPVTTTGQGSTTTTTTTTAAPTASVSNGTATTTINTAMGQEIVRQATANKSENVVIAPSVTGNVTKAEVSIPASTVGQIGSQTNASLTVSTPVADVTIPNGGLGSLGSAGGTVIVTAQQTGNSVELTVTAGGQTVQNVPGGVTLTVPAASTTPGTVAVLVHEDGTREVVRKSVADNGAVTIPLDGSAKLEIVDNSGYFADVPATSWAADAVAFASSHELFNGTAPGQFSPDTPMSRGMLAVVLHNLESNPTQALTGAFTDVDNSQWYAEGVAWAEAQGIIGGYGNGQFGPNDNITREQLAVMLWRYAGSPAAMDRELHFADAHRASDWALEALRWATEKGIINGKGGGILDPTGQATRAETAQMLKNYMENQ